MNIVEHKFEGRIVFVLNRNELEFEFFRESVTFLKLQPNVKIIEYVPALFEQGYIDFEVEGIPAKIYFNNYVGTEMSISDRLEDKQIEQLRVFSALLREKVSSH